MTRQWRIACRSLARRPAFAASTVLILALGIGATTTMFSLLDTVLWKPLPYANPDRLVTVYEANPAKNQNTSLIAPARLEDWNRLSQSFAAITGSYNENVTDTSGAEPERLAGLRVAPGFFAVFGRAPAACSRPMKKRMAARWWPLSAITSGSAAIKEMREPSGSGLCSKAKATRSSA
jgi:hypothetical protein